MDVDAYVRAHRDEWRRLEQLAQRASRPRRLAPAELDELVDLYQRTATHLSVVRTNSPDPVLVDRLSNTVTAARAAIAGVRTPGWREVWYFLAVTYPVGVYTRWRWVVAVAAVALLVAFGVAEWIVRDPLVQRSLVPQQAVQQLVSHEFSDYYRQAPAQSFAAKVWTNNTWVTAGALVTGILLLPTVYLLLLNSINVGVDGGYLIAYGRAGLFFGLIVPHGLLELTCVFIGGAAGLRIGWRVIEPGTLTRADALAAEARSAVPLTLGLGGTLAVSGLLEAFVTPSGLPTWARVGVGVLVWLGFLAYVTVLGRRGVAAGATGELRAGLGVEPVPTAG